MLDNCRTDHAQQNAEELAELLRSGSTSERAPGNRDRHAS